MLLTAYIVDTPLDDPSAGTEIADGVVSLREAIQAANTNLPFGDAPAGDGGGIADQITFAPSLAGQTIALGGVELTVSDHLSITGLGADQLTVSGDNASGVFWIEPDVTVDIAQVTIADGAAWYGAGIYNRGTLMVAGSVLANSTADYGAAIYNEGTLTVANAVLTGNAAAGDGGAIYNEGTLTVTGSLLANNVADGAGGAISNDNWNDAATLTINDTTFLENVAHSSYGGAGLWNTGTLDITRCEFTNNSTAGFGGGIANFSGGIVTIFGSLFTANAASQGGGIHNYSYDPSLRGWLEVAGSNFSGNSSGTGGALWSNLPTQIRDSTFGGNSASFAGGAIFSSSTELMIANSSFLENTSLKYGGGISAWGGSGTVEIIGSTFSGNSAVVEGGAIENSSATVRIANTTVSGNSSDQVGGGIWNYGTLQITNSTVVANRADANGDGTGKGGGFYYVYSSRFPRPVLHNTILAGNALGPAGGDTSDDIWGTVDAASAHNLIGDAGTAGGLVHGVNGNLVGNAGVGAIDISTVLDTNLANHGGPTLTHALVPSGPAVDAGDNTRAVDADGDTLLFDQRGEGFARVYARSVDIGAFEFQPRSVEIDIKPGSDPNSINLASQGVIAVAIFTTDDFDASLINASTVLFAGASAVQSALEDVDGDGDLDMVLHFRVQDTNLAGIYADLLADDIDGDDVLDSNHQTAAVSLTGQTVTDEYFAGFDEVDLFLSGKNLRDLLDRLATANAI